MSLIRRYINNVIKNVSNNLRVATSKIISALIEAGRTISYIETVSNKADTLHRHIKENSELDLKRAFEFNTRKALSRMGLGRVVLAIDTTQELYYGKNGKLNVRQIERGKGADEAFTYVILSIVEPKPWHLMALPYREYVLWILSTPVQFYIGWAFYQGTWAALKNKSANMDSLIAIGTSAAYFYSLYVILFAVDGHQYFEISAVLITFVLLGKYLESRAKSRTSEAISKLLKIGAKTAEEF